MKKCFALQCEIYDILQTANIFVKMLFFLNQKNPSKLDRENICLLNNNVRDSHRALLAYQCIAASLPNTKKYIMPWISTILAQWLHFLVQSQVISMDFCAGVLCSLKPSAPSPGLATHCAPIDQHHTQAVDPHNQELAASNLL